MTVLDDPVTLTHTAAGGDYGGVTTAPLAVTVADDDRAVVMSSGCVGGG